MNLAEKLAAAYLRLNGFFLLPQFTVFTGQQHNHIDIIGLRAANSQELVGNTALAIDDELFSRLSAVLDIDSKTITFGVAAEVRTNEDRKEPLQAHIHYVRPFLGGAPIARLTFSERLSGIDQTSADGLDIGIKHTGCWIQYRIDWMLKQRFNLTKTGSWNWSDDFLSDLLVLKELGFLKSSPGCIRHE